MEWLLEYGEARLKVVCSKNLRYESSARLVEIYDDLVDYINRYPLFKISYEPVEVGPDVAEIVRLMSKSAFLAGVGPMASVAGAFSQLIGEYLVGCGGEDVIVDNGGDIYLNLTSEKVVGLYAGHSPVSGRISLRVKPDETPVGVCTSSASVGPSISLGDSDAVTVVADSSAIADAAATAIGNVVRGGSGVELGIKTAKGLECVRGVIIVSGERMGCFGNLPEIK